MRGLVSNLALFTTIATFGHGAHALVARGTPTAQDWVTLNKTVGGRLGVGLPWAKPCFSVYNGKSIQTNPGECKFVQDNYFNKHIPRSDAFGATSATQWETCMATSEGCELNWQNVTDVSAFTPPAECKQGNVPDYYIDVKDKDDVIAGLKFARKTGVPLVIKNTGHDFQGRSSGRGALSLWTHHIKHISYDSKFVADGCSRGSQASAITIGAGSQLEEINKFADENNFLVIGGTDKSVGAGGGWILGGGHSALTPTHGMGVDRVLQFKLVTPDGKYRVANACQNQDLFFALRGGGGGTFGVLLEVSLRTAARTPIRVANINWDVSDDNFAAVLKVFIDNATTFAEQGWGGYITPGIGNGVFLNPKLSQQEAEASMKALIDVTATMGRVSNITESRTYYEWFEQWSDVLGRVGAPAAMTSRLVPQKNHATAEARAELFNATLAAAKLSSSPRIHMTTPYAYTGEVSGTSVTPAWRISLWQMLLINAWPYNASLADKKAAYANATEGINHLRKITPGSGAYHNEADIHEPNHEVSFWGSNYNRLLQIKKKYDPDHILDCWHCVGSSGEKSPRFACYI